MPARQLPMELEGRLFDVAARHGGRVPLHSRLFLQWLHHAYPSECPFPHVSGSLHPATQEEWMLQTGEDVLASELSLEKEVSEIKANLPEKSERMRMPWLDQEELLVGPARGAVVAMGFADVAQG